VRHLPSGDRSCQERLVIAIVATIGLVGGCARSRSAEPSTGVRCAKGEYFVPGCSDEPGIVAGCYERCAGAEATCGAGTTCASVTVMPACALAEGDVACAACGEDVQLCVPSATD
jgi:hypothetical protein